MSEEDNDWINDDSGSERGSENEGEKETEEMVINPTSIRDRIDVRYPKMLLLLFVLSRNS